MNGKRIEELGQRSDVACVSRCGCVMVTRTVLMALMRCRTATLASVQRGSSGLFFVPLQS